MFGDLSFVAPRWWRFWQGDVRVRHGHLCVCWRSVTDCSPCLGGVSSVGGTDRCFRWFSISAGLGSAQLNSAGGFGFWRFGFCTAELRLGGVGFRRFGFSTAELCLGGGWVFIVLGWWLGLFFAGSSWCSPNCFRRRSGFYLGRRVPTSCTYDRCYIKKPTYSTI